MRKTYLYIFSILSVVVLFTSCSDMNDIHDMYLENGERLYIGKVDSLKAYPGNERVKLVFWASDPRAKTVGFYWYPNNDSMFVDIEHTSNSDSFEVVIGGTGSEKSIPEGNYTLKVVTNDNKGHYSVPFEKIMTIYGPKLQSTLTNRIIKSIAFEESEGLLSVFFSGPVSDKELGVGISYTDKNGILQNLYIPDSSIGDQTDIPNVDPSKGVKYQTYFLPDPTAIDTFVTEPERIEIVQTINVALNKPVMVSDILRDDFPGSNAVDGIIADNSRWVSSASGEHWIEIDLEGEYPVHSFEIWNGSGGKVNTPLPDLRFQVFVDGEWQTIVEETANTNANYVAVFDEITTSKVKFLTNTQTRIFELAVYVTVRY
ncbi:MAG: DUF4998 domain-containing protein [Draconibacterium sp.]